MQILNITAMLRPSDSATSKPYPVNVPEYFIGVGNLQGIGLRTVLQYGYVSETYTHQTNLGLRLGSIRVLLKTSPHAYTKVSSLSITLKSTLSKVTATDMYTKQAAHLGIKVATVKLEHTQGLGKYVKFNNTLAIRLD